MLFSIFKLGLSAGRAGSFLDQSIGWRAEGPETDHQHQSIKSILGLGDAQVSSISDGSRWSLQMSPESAKKITEFCCDLAGSG